MNFELTDTQRLLVDSVDRLLRTRAGFEDRQRVLAGDAGWDAALWKSMADLGMTALPLDASLGAVGEAGGDVMWLMQCLGRALSTEPYLSSCVLAGTALRVAVGDSARAELLEQLAEGASLATLAWDEQRHEGTRAERLTANGSEGDHAGWRLRGRKRHVLHAASADWLVVSAHVGEPERTPGLFLVPRGAPGVSVQVARRMDGMPTGWVTFEDVQLSNDACLAQGQAAQEALETAIDHATAATVADAVGAMEAALKLCIEYVRTRRQFGKAIGDFQVVQHRLADMRIALEQTRSMALYAACSLSLSDVEHRAAAISAAKLVLDDAARTVAHGAIQLHGGMGMVEEHAVTHYVRRLVAARGSFGDLDHHARRMTAAGGLMRYEREEEEYQPEEME